MRRLDVFFFGDVQGVGFRKTAERIALDFGLVGMVRNLPNGSVQVQAEGENASLFSFIEKLSEYFCLTSIEVQFEAPLANYKTFSIEF
jgi:acylphosphatase